MVNRAKRPDRRHLLDAARHPARRDGVIALTLFLLPWVALLLVRRHHLDAGAIVAVISAVAAVSIGLSTLWLTWAALREVRRSDGGATGLNLGQVADQLAVAVGTQWNAEAAMRRLNDPYPLPVSWAAADPSLTDPWDLLVKLASSGAGWPPPGENWAAGPDDLAGEGGELADVLARVPTGRLVVLGEPGAGKTMLMVRLVLDLLARRDSGDPVPIPASVASWNPAGQGLRDWLGAQLLIDHPALAAAPSAGRAESTQAEALLSAGLILPVLDGLDEIPEGVRGAAVSRINDALRPGEQVVVTCRTEQYRDAVRPQGGVEVTLRAAAAVQLRPLDAAAIRRYLCHDAGGPVARARWDPVLAVLGTEAPAGQALRTPLMIGLARAIYNPRPDELAGTLRDPAKLCDPTLNDQTAVESLLFDAFIPAAYRDDAASRWTAQQAEPWLEFLARHLEQTIGSPNLAWWQLPQAISHLDELESELRRAQKPAQGIRISVHNIMVGLAFGVVVGLAFGVVFGTAAGIGIGIAAGVGIGTLFVFVGVPGDLARVASPGAVLARDRQAALLIMLVGGLGAGLAAVLATRFFPRVAPEIYVGLASVLTAWCWMSTSQTAWLSYVLTRGWLALRHRLPWRLMDFLNDAHRRGVLRQAGAVYQFRHIELQHRLANRP